MRTIYTVAPARRLMARYFNAYRQVFFYAALFLAGILAGALVLRNLNPETAEKLSFLVGQFAQQRGAQAFSNTFASSLFSACVLLGIVFLCGFCAVARPAIVLLPLFRGLGYGYQAGWLYARYGWGGVGYTSLVLMPSILFSTVVLLFACAEAFEMSGAYYRAARGDGFGGTVSVRGYCIKFMFFLLLMLASALLDAGFTALFGGLFSIT